MTRIPVTLTLPGRDAWNHVLRDELDRMHGACHLAGVIAQIAEA